MPLFWFIFNSRGQAFLPSTELNAPVLSRDVQRFFFERTNKWNCSLNKRTMYKRLKFREMKNYRFFKQMRKKTKNNNLKSFERSWLFMTMISKYFLIKKIKLKNGRFFNWKMIVWPSDFTKWLVQKQWINEMNKVEHTHL